MAEQAHLAARRFTAGTLGTLLPDAVQQLLAGFSCCLQLHCCTLCLTSNFHGQPCSWEVAGSDLAYKFILYKTLQATMLN
jgi:hypothetical protein